MYTVIIVDDEPAAVSYISQIITKRCQGFEVIDVAYDGQEGLDIIINQKPDIAILDICMPMFSGLDISEKLKEYHIDTKVIIVSGYSEFEYAKQAIKNDVVDYLLKPVVPDEIARIFTNLKDKFDMQLNQEQYTYLRRLCLGEKKLDKYCVNLSERKYYVGIIRYNGISNQSIFDCSKYVFSEMNETIFTFGRDDKENLYICPEEVVTSSGFENILLNRMNKDTAEVGYSTIVMYSTPVYAKEVGGLIESIYKILKDNIILGKTHIVKASAYKKKSIHYSDQEKKLWMSFHYHLEKKEYRKEKENLYKLFLIFQEEERPIYWIISQLERIAQSKDMDGKGFEQIRQFENEILEDIAISSLNMEQLWSGVDDYFYANQKEIKQIEKLDTEEFIEVVCGYLSEHMKQAITIEELAIKFSVSATYLAKLFKKHRGVTVNVYLTMLRMEKAKELIQCVDNILIKDIAEQLGYKDQFYFSRVFRSYTGKSPSDYIDQVKSE